MRTAVIVIASSLAVIAVAGGAVYAAAQAFDTTETEHATVSRSVDHVVIEAESGDIEIVPGGPSVEIQETDRYLFDSPEVNRKIEDDVLTIESECGGVLSVFCATDYRVEVPKGVTVDVRTYVGDIEIEKIDARRIDARAYVGDVHVDSRLKGDIAARTNVGDVEVELPKGTYAVDADTGVGDSDIDGVIAADRARNAIDARTDVGTVDVRAR